MTHITASCSGLAFYGGTGPAMRIDTRSEGTRNAEWWKEVAMRLRDCLEIQDAVQSPIGCVALLHAAGCEGEEMESSREGFAYRGSWAKQRVVARLATKRTRKATRMTTTPPTVKRSQRSEELRASVSCFAVMAVVLTHSFTGCRKVCSDQDHKLVPRVWRRLRSMRDLKVFPFIFEERRLA